MSLPISRRRCSTHPLPASKPTAGRRFSACRILFKLEFADVRVTDLEAWHRLSDSLKEPAAFNRALVSKERTVTLNMIRIECRRMCTRLLKSLPSLAVFLAALIFPTAHAADEPLVLAVHPYLPAAEIQTRFGPVAEYLARAIGRPVTVSVGSSYAEHESAIGSDRVDIAFLGPASYIEVVRRFGAKPLLARFQVDGQASLYGIIAVRKESVVTTLAGLKDAHIAFGAPESTMSHFVPRYLLMQAGVRNGAARHKFLGSHNNVALSLLAGDFDAGAMKKEVFDEFAPKGLRAVAVTPGVPDHLFVTRRNLPAADIKRLRDALLQLKDVPEGAAILNKMHKGLTALIPVADADYNALRKMIRAVAAASR